MLPQGREKIVDPANLSGGAFARVSGGRNHGVSFCGAHWERFLVFRQELNLLIGYKTLTFPELG